MSGHEALHLTQWGHGFGGTGDVHKAGRFFREGRLHIAELSSVEQPNYGEFSLVLLPFELFCRGKLR